MKEIQKQNFKPGNMIYPLPPVMISVSDELEKDNIITIAWAGTICTNPPMVSISVRPSRYSYQLIKKSKDFVINLTTEELVFATDYCGVKSGRDVDKFKELNLTKKKADIVKAPLIVESPVNIECKVTKCLELGSHNMFIAEVVAVHVNTDLIDKNGKFQLNQSGLVAYSHGEYFLLGKSLGKFGFSVAKDLKQNEKKDKYSKSEDKGKYSKSNDKGKYSKSNDKGKYGKSNDKDKYGKPDDKDKYRKLDDKGKYSKSDDKDKYSKSDDKDKHYRNKEKDFKYGRKKENENEKKPPKYPMKKRGR